MYTEKMFDSIINLAFTKKGTLSDIMKIKSRFVLKRGVLLDLKISDFGWKRGVFLAQNAHVCLYTYVISSLRHNRPSVLPVFEQESNPDLLAIHGIYINLVVNILFALTLILTIQSIRSGDYA